MTTAVSALDYEEILAIGRALGENNPEFRRAAELAALQGWTVAEFRAWAMGALSSARLPGGYGRLS